jgi:hypothetical protein
MRIGIQALPWIICIASARAQVSSSNGGDGTAGKSSRLVSIVNGCVLNGKHPPDFIISSLCARPAG